MFGRIARRYDLANRLLSGGMDVWWRRRLVQAVGRQEPQTVVDLATGSGDVAFALARKLEARVQITGMDFCQPMLDQAIAKQAATSGAAKRIIFKVGDGMALPLADQTVDALTISFGLRNMSDRQRSLAEMWRVLRPGGRAYILEFSQPQRWFRPIYFFYLRHVLPRLAGWVTGDRQAYVYLNETIESFPGRDALTAEIRAAGFRAASARAMTFGIVALHEAMR